MVKSKKAKKVKEVAEVKEVKVKEKTISARAEDLKLEGLSLISLLDIVVELAKKIE